MTEPITVTDAITIRDPWAQAIVWGPKRVENRSWKPPRFVWGKYIAIHVSKEMDQYAAREILSGRCAPPLDQYRQWMIDQAVATDCPADLDYRHYPGRIIGVARLVGVRKDAQFHYFFNNYASPFESADPWYQGHGAYGWLLDSVRPLRLPVPCRGARAVWSIPEDVLQQMEVESADEN